MSQPHTHTHEHTRTHTLLRPTGECVLQLSYPLHHHPGVVLPDARRALVVGAAVLQDVVFDLAVGLR